MLHTESNTNAVRPRRPIWAYVVVGLLCAHVAGMMVAVAITRNDRTFLVVPDYYDKGQHWDAAQAEKRASEKLGWQVRIEPSPQVDAGGWRAVSFVLTDAGGKAVGATELQVAYFHHAHPDQQKKMTLSADREVPGRYTQLLPMREAGIWEFHFGATAAGSSFTSTQTQYLINASQAASAMGPHSGT